jgi:type II secretory pathway pseudopilin PulG
MGVVSMVLKLNNKRQGSAYAFVLVVFLIISIIGSSILFIFNNNLKQAKRQQDSLEAYYLAYSGVEMAYAALLSKKPNGDLKLKDLDSNELVENNINYGNGTINILAKKSERENFENWIEITSTGILSRNNLSYTRTLYFDPDNPIDMIWEN